MTKDEFKKIAVDLLYTERDEEKNSFEFYHDELKIFVIFVNKQDSLDFDVYYLPSNEEQNEITSKLSKEELEKYLEEKTIHYTFNIQELQGLIKDFDFIGAMIEYSSNLLYLQLSQITKMIPNDKDLGAYIRRSLSI